ncbi:MAG: hypothetical protein K6U80_02405 [Firmicutes bacterium]|nr:hypothetical protein [Bacillota bacterium]
MLSIDHNGQQFQKQPPQTAGGLIERNLKMNIFIPVWILLPVAGIIGFLSFVGAGVLWVAYIEGYWRVLWAIRYSRKRRRMK